MRAVNSSPSFWSGIAASEYYFENTSDYSEWACGLLEAGHDTNCICVLAGLFDEENLFELRKWHRLVLRDLGFHELSPRALFLAHVRGYAEEFIDGKRDFKDVTQHFHEVQMDADDELLESFDALHYGYWDFDDVDMSDMGISSLDDFPRACTDACKDLLKKIEAEQGGGGNSAAHRASP